MGLKTMTAHAVPHDGHWAVQAENGEFDGYKCQSGRFFVWVWHSRIVANIMAEDFERRLRGRY